MKKKVIHFLPSTRREVEMLGWDSIDVIIFSGDAYVDHPSFGTAIIGRYLESLGLKVAIVPQPNWRDDLRDFKKLGVPNLFFAVTAGNMDSMVNHYTAQKRLRSNDAYTPGGKAGLRPDYATVVYSNIIKKLFPESLLIIGGIEASLRRLTHYDYWSDSLKPSVLYESKADFLVYGMAELSLNEIVNCLKNKNIEDLKKVKQLAYLVSNDGNSKLSDNIFELPSFQACVKDKKVFAEAFVSAEKQINLLNPKILVQKVFDKSIIINPPYHRIETEQLDAIYELPYLRKPHYKYDKKEAIPAYEMIKNSVTIHRGCFGGCAFCALSAHQGKFISSRSEGSVLKELGEISKSDDFKGHISDLGGPSANMYKMTAMDESLCGKCSRPSCLFPHTCLNLNTSHKPLVSLYKKASELRAVKKITIGSGIRYDMFFSEKKQVDGVHEYVKLLLSKHVSGRLKVAPEHTSEQVLKIMRKPSFNSFLEFKKMFTAFNKQLGLNNMLVPYFISSHPGTTYNDMAELASIGKKHNLFMDQVQDFTPTPMTLSSVIYYTGIDPYTNNSIYVPKTLAEKANQKKFFMYNNKENVVDVRKIINMIKRKDIEDYLFNKEFSQKNKHKRKFNK